MILNNHPNLILRSTVHKIDALVETGIPLVTINMGIQDIWLADNTVMEHLDPEEIDISEVTTKTALMIVDLIVNGNKRRILGKSLPFLLSLLHLLILKLHRKVKLKDK